MTPPTPDEPTRPIARIRGQSAVAAGIVIGAALGVVFGALFWDVSRSIIIGVALGVVAGAALGQLRG